MKTTKLRCGLVLMAIFFFATNTLSTEALPKEVASTTVKKNKAVEQIQSGDKIKALVSKTPLGNKPGEMDLTASVGFADIPGAPKINFLIAFLWAVWVGWIFSTIGAFGGVMAGVGHLTVFGLGNYAASFQTTNPELNALLTDTIRASNQYMVALAALISTYSFFKMRRIVVPLGIALGIGSIAGGLFIPWLTAGKVNLKEYLGYFGLAVVIIGGVIFYSTTALARSKKNKSNQATEAIKKAMKECQNFEDNNVKITQLSFTKIKFDFFGTEFNFNPLLPLIGGLIIASISSFLGVGGGFLYVPFLTSVVGLPMFIVAGTSALAVFLSMITSIFSYVVIKGTFISWGLVGIEMVGVFVGAFIGPRTQRFFSEIWLKRIFVLLAIYVGVRYLSKGFFGQSWLPPF